MDEIGRAPIEASPTEVAVGGRRGTTDGTSPRAAYENGRAALLSRTLSKTV